MRLTTKWLIALFLLLALPLSGCGFLQKLKARDNVNKGVKAFTDQKYSAAAQYFEKAIDLDPNLENARMYLATTYTSQYIPGSVDPKSEEMAKKAIEIFSDIVSRASDPNKPNINAMLSIASLYYQLKQYQESKDWCNKILKVDGQNAEAYYRIAVIDYDQSYEQTGIEGEMVSYMPPEKTIKVLNDIEEGLTALDKAIEIKSNYFDAMEYQNLLWREKAKFEKDATKKAELTRKADQIYLKSVDLKLKAEKEEASKHKKLNIKR